jgi:hypothetical protein
MGAHPLDAILPRFNDESPEDGRFVARRAVALAIAVAGRA